MARLVSRWSLVLSFFVVVSCAVDWDMAGASEASAEVAAGDGDVDDLVQAAQRGDRAALGMLYRRFSRPVYRVVLRVVRNPEDASELTQQVFVRVMEALPRYRQGREPFERWLFVVARNQALDHVRRKQHSSPEDPADIRRRQEAAHGAACEPQFDWTDSQVAALLRGLSLAQRRVLTLRYVYDLTPAEIAD